MYEIFSSISLCNFNGGALFSLASLGCISKLALVKNIALNLKYKVALWA